MASRYNEQSAEGVGGGKESVGREEKNRSDEEGEAGGTANSRTSANARGGWRKKEVRPSGLDVLWSIKWSGRNHRRNGRLSARQAES